MTFFRVKYVTDSMICSEKSQYLIALNPAIYPGLYKASITRNGSSIVILLVVESIGIGMYDPRFILLIQPLLFHLERSLPASCAEIFKISASFLREVIRKS